MKVFELKRNIDLKWEDIPFVECPVFATTHAMNALIHPSDPSSQVTNIREFIVNELGVYDSLRNHNYAEERVNSLMGFGHYFSICRSGKPFVAAFTWKEDKDHPHQGVWTDPLDHYWMSPNRIKNLLAEIANEWHRVQSQSYMEELMDSPYAIARAVEDEYLAIPKAKKEIAVKPVAAVMPSTKIVKPVKNATSVAKVEKPKVAYKVLKGKYGSLHDYGDHIVHWDIDNIVGRADITSKPAYKVRHCYALGEGFGLPITDNIAPGKSLLNFGGEIPHGTIFATFVPDGKGQLVYPNSRNGIEKSPHLFVYDAEKNGLVEISDGVYKVDVIEQWANLEKVSQNTIKHNSTDSKSLYKNLENYYAVTVKK